MIIHLVFFIIYIVAVFYSLYTAFNIFIYYSESYFLSLLLIVVVILFTFMAPTTEDILRLDTRGLFCSMNIRGEVCIFCVYFLKFLLLHNFYSCLLFILYFKAYSLGMLIVHSLLSFKKNLVMSGPLQIAQGMYI